jgi:hypothetical protein
MTNPNVYPVTAEFEKNWEAKVTPHKHVLGMYKVMAENIGEYEGGHADLDGVTLEQYVEVCEDVLLTMLEVHN